MSTNGMRAGIVLQARMGSQRLPGKALALLGGTTLLQRCLARLQASSVGEVVLATTDAPEDDVLAALAAAMGCEVHRGDSDDVLGRMLDAALWRRFDVVIRATGDNPAVDMAAAGRLLRVLGVGVEYACEDGLPCGSAVEAITVAALRTAATQATLAADREHVTTFIKRHPERFRVQRVLAPRALQRPDLRLTVDTFDDLTYLRRVFARTQSLEPSLAAIVAAADRCPRRKAA